MLRKLIFVLCAIALTSSACGRQVTPNRTGAGASGVPSGYIEIKFDTAGALDFTNNVYVLAVNTTTGQEPYAKFATQQYNYLNLDWEIVVTNNSSGVPAATMVPFVTQQSVAGGTTKVPGPILYPTAQQLTITANCNGSGTEFCLLISRVLFSQTGLVPTGSPSTSPTGSPTGSPTSSPTSSPTASPTGSPSASPTGSPSSLPSANPSATGLPAGNWAINWWVATPAGGTNGGQIIDAPGLQGTQDTSTFTFTVDTNAAGSCTSSNGSNCIWTALPPPSWPTAPTTSAQIAGGTVLNSP